MSESKIEGIETISNRFQHMYSALKKKPYDPLDHRKPDFEADFLEFRRQISEIQVCNIAVLLLLTEANSLNIENKSFKVL